MSKIYFGLLIQNKQILEVWIIIPLCWANLEETNKKILISLSQDLKCFKYRTTHLSSVDLQEEVKTRLFQMYR